MNREDSHGVYDNDDKQPITRGLRNNEENPRQPQHGFGDKQTGSPTDNTHLFPGNRKKPAESKENDGLFNAAGDGTAGLPEAEKAAVIGAAARSLAPGAQSFAGKATKFFFGSKKRKQRTAAGGLTVVAVGGVLAGSAFLSGPLEFVHIAQLLEQFHFSSQQDESNDRVSKLIRYAHYAPSGDAYKTNLNYVGNKLADKFEAKLNEQGLRSAYTKTFGLKDGYVIDRNNENFAGLTDDQIQQELREKYNSPNLEVTKYTDQRGVEQLLLKQPSGYRSSLGITRETLKEAGYSKISSAIGARIMGTRDGVTWHPLQKLDNKIYRKLDEKIAEWNKEKAQNISEGEPTNPTGAAEPDSNSSDTTAERDQKSTNADSASSEGNNVAQEGDAVAQEARSGNDADGGKLSAFRDSVSAKVAGGGVAAAGVLCMARGIAANAGNVKQKQTALPLIRTGMRIVSEGNQVMSNQDIDIQQLANDAKQFDDKRTGQSWYNAQSIQAELGHPEKGVPPDQTLQKLSSGTPLDFLLGGNALADALNPICSTAGVVIQNVVGFLGGPVSFIGGALVSQFVGPPVVDSISQYLAGQAVKLNPSGPEFGNYVNFGSFLAANDQGISSGGRALTPDETSQLADITNNDYQQRFQKHNIAYRLFNPMDRMSLISSVIDQQSGSMSSNVRNIALATVNVGSSLTTTFSSIFSGVGHAASQPYNYGGMPEIAFSEAELDNPNAANPYANADVVADILSSSSGPDYISRAQKCFGDTIQQTSVNNPDGSQAQVWDVQYGTDPINIYSGDYKAIQGSCNDSGDLNWLRIRFFIFDTQTAKAAACWTGDDQSCSDIGYGEAASSSASVATSPDGTLPTGNVQQLAQQIIQLHNQGKITYALDTTAIDNNFKRMANGQNPQTDNGHEPTPDPHILQAIIYLSQQGTVQINSYVDGASHTSPGNPHYEGKAVDIGAFNSHTLGSGDEATTNDVENIVSNVLPEHSRFGADFYSDPSWTAPITLNGKTFYTGTDAGGHLHMDTMGAD